MARLRKKTPIHVRKEVVEDTSPIACRPPFIARSSISFIRASWNCRRCRHGRLLGTRAPLRESMGPSMLFHLGGGEGGIKHFMDRIFRDPVASWWKDLGSFTEWPEGSKQTIVDGVLKEADGRSIDELAETRDELLLDLVKLRLAPDADPCEIAKAKQMGDRIPHVSHRRWWRWRSLAAAKAA